MCTSSGDAVCAAADSVCLILQGAVGLLKVCCIHTVSVLHGAFTAANFSVGSNCVGEDTHVDYVQLSAHLLTSLTTPLTILQLLLTDPCVGPKGT